ncbi:MAG: ABC transporter ATP-binding protein [Bifidobacteriaceae bacterium]|jgi:putative ABC transport system ATP-binding protein|nr:ABC transporter ATP-binding protein [Bifidobacteriaceae bacterium]
MSTPIIEISGLSRTYGAGESAVAALADASLRVERGEFVAIMGHSGSGKSTMMNLLGLLDVADAGTYWLDGTDVSSLRGDALARIRNRQIGFVFQSFNLIPSMPALANVELPMAYAGVKRAERRHRAMAALELVGLTNRASHRPGELSGGQLQRVAIARALVNTPALILADEPTGNLDSTATADVLDVFEQLNNAGRTIVLITHESEVAERAHRTVRMRDGRILAGSAAKVPAAPAAPHPGPGGDHDLSATLPNGIVPVRIEPAKTTVIPGVGA